MIAKVKIAPVEQWCEVQQQKVADNRAHGFIAGLWIEILTETMTQDESGKHWITTEDSYLKMCRAANRLPTPYAKARVCEHILEMD